MKVLLTLERYVENINEIIHKIKKDFPESEISEDSSTNKLVISFDNKNLLKSFRDLPFIGKIIVLKTDFLEFNSLKDIITKSVEILKHENIKGSFKIQVKTSGDSPVSDHVIKKRVGSTIKSKLNLEYEKKDAANILYIEIKKNKKKFFFRLGISDINLYSKRLIRISSEIFKNLIVAIENPTTPHELADFLRVSLFFGLPLRIIGEKSKINPLLNKARKIIKGESWNNESDVKVIESASVLKNSFSLLGFSLWAKGNEESFSKLISGDKKLAFIFGNEHKGLTVKTRNLLDEQIHLGPNFPEPLRGSQALTYALGFYGSRKI